MSKPVNFSLIPRLKGIQNLRGKSQSDPIPKSIRLLCQSETASGLPLSRPGTALNALWMYCELVWTERRARFQAWSERKKWALLLLTKLSGVLCYTSVSRLAFSWGTTYKCLFPSFDADPECGGLEKLSLEGQKILFFCRNFRQDGR